MSSLISATEKEQLNFKSEHFTLFEDLDKLASFLKTNNSEGVSNSYIRVLKHASRNPAQQRTLQADAMHLLWT